ncbi:MAG TPA: hypothetical protein VEK80_10155 [Kribbellaceae bacterium]|nr:hypothetical protein [Kribbellaceae bacterium]
MERYFDAFLYLANWGTRRVMLRLPARLLTLGVASRYCVGDLRDTSTRRPGPANDHRRPPTRPPVIVPDTTPADLPLVLASRS